MERVEVELPAASRSWPEWRGRSVLVELENVLHGLQRLDVKIHTQWRVLNEKFCELFSQHGVGAGISLDVTVPRTTARRGNAGSLT
jgi:hypothetical protein